MGSGSQYFGKLAAQQTRWSPCRFSGCLKETKCYIYGAVDSEVADLAGFFSAEDFSGEIKGEIKVSGTIFSLALHFFSRAFRCSRTATCRAATSGHANEASESTGIIICLETHFPLESP